MKLQNKEQVVGYDAREMWLDLDLSWPERRRETYLYKPSVTRPLSVDTAVWPSIFSLDNKATWASHFGYQESWADLSELQQALTKYHDLCPVRPFRIIAIALFLGEYNCRDGIDWGIRIPPDVKPDRIPEGWQFLGYDVADSFLLSVLSNCSLPSRPEQAAAEREKWGPELNEYHLFVRFESAVDFKRRSDERLKGSHAPCSVFGLWTLA